MADQTVVRIGENTPEFVAYKLMNDLIAISTDPAPKRDQKWVLDLYAECLETVRNPHKRQGRLGISDAALARSAER
jgi:hypothetical protein